MTVTSSPMPFASTVRISASTISLRVSGGQPLRNVVMQVQSFKSQTEYVASCRSDSALTNFHIFKTSDILSLSYISCTSFFLNQASTPLNYCRTDFVGRFQFVEHILVINLTSFRLLSLTSLPRIVKPLRTPMVDCVLRMTVAGLFSKWNL